MRDNLLEKSVKFLRALLRNFLEAIVALWEGIDKAIINIVQDWKKLANNFYKGRLKSFHEDTPHVGWVISFIAYLSTWVWYPLKLITWFCYFSLISTFKFFFHGIGGGIMGFCREIVNF